ncbi:MAG: isoform A [Trebouxia sp. A1-2]|nr:MAG: isoform A [Trebouxia sp. A1-2]
MVITKRIQSGLNSSHHVDHSVLLKSLAQLWEQKELCDCVLVSADQRHFHAHRLVLTAASHYFKVLFLGSGQQMQNSGTKDDCGLYTIHLDQVDSHSLNLVMQAIYQQDFQVTEAVLEQLLMAASYLQIESIITACAQLATTAATPTKLLHGRHTEDIAALTKDSLLALLDAAFRHDIETFKAVLLWADADPATRAPHIPQLCDRVPAPKLHKLLEGVQQLPCTPDVKAAVLQWVQSQQHDLKAASSGSTGCTLDDFSRHHQPGHGQLLIAGGHDVTWQSLRSVELYDSSEDKWSRGIPMPNRESFAGCAVLQSEVALLGGGLHGRSMTLYNPTAQSWRTAEAPHTPHLHSAVASMQDSLFVLGGRAGNGTGSELCTVEMCSSIPTGASSEFEGPTPVEWLFTSDMTVPRTCLAAASLGGSLYAVGGQAGRQIWDTVEAYDAQQDAWVQLRGHMHSERKYTSAGVLHGRLYVAGGMTSTRTRLASVEAYDPREGKWSLIAAMGVPRSSAGVAALADCLFAVGGNAGDDWIHDSVEMYIPAAGRWLQRASIAFARSGLAIAAL